MKGCECISKVKIPIFDTRMTCDKQFWLVELFYFDFSPRFVDVNPLRGVWAHFIIDTNDDVSFGDKAWSASLSVIWFPKIGVMRRVTFLFTDAQFACRMKAHITEYFLLSTESYLSHSLTLQ